MDDAITGYLRGGLGNQMFIAAASLEQSRRLNVPLRLNTSFLKSGTQHPGDLQRLDHGGELVVKGRRGVQFDRYRFSKVMRPLQVHTSVFAEKSFTFDPAIDTVRPGAHLVGYFQSWRYFRRTAEEVRRRFTTIVEPSSWYLETSEELDQLGSWVGLHIRQGDYLDPAVAQIHGQVSSAYISRALALVQSQQDSRRVVLFSDEPDRALRLHPDVSGWIVMKPPARSHPIESLLLMARSPSLITANSSFSWWAGFLGDRAGRLVVCPRPWFGTLGHDTRDLLPPTWVTVGAREDS